MTTQRPVVAALPTPDVSENIRSFKGKAVAYRHAKEWANWNAPDHEVEEGEVFEVQQFNGGYHVAVWLQYSVSTTDEGYTITVNRWYSNPEA
jgi:hypothetical protein